MSCRLVLLPGRILLDMEKAAASLWAKETNMSFTPCFYPFPVTASVYQGRRHQAQGGWTLNTPAL